LAEELVQKAGWCVDLAHPGFVARMKQNPDKTDCQDAFLLADLERVGYLPRVWLAPEYVRELRRLVRHRQVLVQQRRATKLRMRALLRDNRCAAPAGVNPWTKKWYAWLTYTAQVSTQSRYLLEKHLQEVERLRQECLEVEKRMRAFTAEDAIVARLLEQAGVGLVTAWWLRAEVGRFDRFRSGKQLARFCGLSPRNASSGQRQADAGLIRAANPQLRSVLLQTAHTLARVDPRWSALKKRLRAQGKPGSVAAAAVGNRWIRWLYHQMKSIAA
jgi:transposase